MAPGMGFGHLMQFLEVWNTSRSCSSGFKAPLPGSASEGGSKFLKGFWGCWGGLAVQGDPRPGFFLEPAPASSKWKSRCEMFLLHLLPALLKWEINDQIRLLTLQGLELG